MGTVRDRVSASSDIPKKEGAKNITFLWQAGAGRSNFQNPKSEFETPHRRSDKRCTRVRASFEVAPLFFPRPILTARKFFVQAACQSGLNDDSYSHLQPAPWPLKDRPRVPAPRAAFVRHHPVFVAMPAVLSSIPIPLKLSRRFALVDHLGHAASLSLPFAVRSSEVRPSRGHLKDIASRRL
ncbi:hypothetical protein EDB84DRAFT_1435616 [Lactarius hengduanensis]|nr:hypothetical protein EDB84DRAFT_1435616 [Lactarius hengduanensis]